jgi:hypothetical protein
MELLAIDHWMQHKIKPARSYWPEWEKKEKFALLDQLQLPHQKYRYVVTETSFDHEAFMQNGMIIPGKKIFLLEFDGIKKPRICEAFEKVT